MRTSPALFEALKEVNRPDEIDWKLIRSVRKAAWKTGTSYGYRDAWAVGVTPDYAVGVWCGNADGHGVPAMTGAKTAGPVLFDLLNLLPPSADWFEEPIDGGVFLDVCKASGMLKSQDCPEYETIQLPAQAAESAVCPYHKDGTFRLPPGMEWYYKTWHPEYQVQPAAHQRQRQQRAGNEHAYQQRTKRTDRYEAAERDFSAFFLLHAASLLS